MADDSNKQNPRKREFFADLTDEGAKEAAHFAAARVAELLRNYPAAHAVALKNANKIAWGIRALRFGVGNNTLSGRFVNEFISDFGSHLPGELKKSVKPEDKQPAPADPLAVRMANEADIFARLCLATAMLDEKASDAFWFWYEKLDEGRRKKFHQLIAKTKDEQLAGFVKMNPTQLNRMLDLMPGKPAATAESRLTYPLLRTAIKAGATLDQQVQDFLALLGTDLTSKFWAAINSRCPISLDDFRGILAMGTDEAKRYLGLDEKSFGQRVAGIQATVNQKVTDSGAVRAAEGFRDRMKGFFDKGLSKVK